MSQGKGGVHEDVWHEYRGMLFQGRVNAALFCQKAPTENSSRGRVSVAGRNCFSVPRMHTLFPVEISYEEEMMKSGPM